MESIKEFPRGINSDQVISRGDATAAGRRAPGPGLQQVIEETVPHNDIEEASSNKRQASSHKLQATSNKLQASGEAASSKRWM